MDERRQAPRVEPRQPLRAKVKASVPVRIVDISTGGAQIELATALRPHVSCELRLLLDKNEVIIHSTVRRCRAWGFGFDDADRKVLLYRAGVEFESMPAPLIDRLKAEYLERAVASAPRETATPRAATAMDVTPAGAEDSAAKPAAPRKAPRKGGPVKIRISADSIRGILDRDDK